MRILILIFCFTFNLAHAQVGNKNISQILEDYDSSRQEALLWQVYFLANKDPIATYEWFNIQTKKYPELNYYAGLVFSDRKEGYRAVGFFEDSWNMGRIGGGINIANIYFQGDGLPINKKRGCEWFKKVLDREPTSRIATEYGICLDSSFEVIPGVSQSLSEACAWYKKGADSYFTLYEDALKYSYLRFDHGRAYLLYGLCLNENKYNSLDIKTSAIWIKRSAEMNHPYGLYEYGNRLIEGRGFVQSFGDGLKALTKAAELKSAVAQNALGIIYAEGRVATKNMPEAYKWFVIATANGYENAQSNKSNAEKKLSSSEVTLMQTKAKQWQDKYYKN